jgi:uncharacterized protein YndB with AHSA1/START domain
MTVPDLTATMTVETAVDKAFEVFTGSFDSWWPRDYHIGQADMAEVVLEPRAGGRWYERGVDGSECDWGRVLLWEPPRRLVFTWQINGRWEYDPEPSRASEVDVTFAADGPDRTVVSLVHRHLDRLDGGQAIHDGITGGGSWSSILTAYADVLHS